MGLLYALFLDHVSTCFVAALLLLCCCFVVCLDHHILFVVCLDHHILQYALRYVQSSLQSSQLGGPSSYDDFHFVDSGLCKCSSLVGVVWEVWNGLSFDPI